VVDLAGSCGLTNLLGCNSYAHRNGQSRRLRLKQQLVIVQSLHHIGRSISYSTTAVSDEYNLCAIRTETTKYHKTSQCWKIWGHTADSNEKIGQSLKVTWSHEAYIYLLCSLLSKFLITFHNLAQVLKEIWLWLKLVFPSAIEINEMK